MAFLVNQKFEAEAVLISNLLDGTRLVFAKGRFDHWCIYHVRNQFDHAIRDCGHFFSNLVSLPSIQL